jgi:hypothetical protein
MCTGWTHFDADPQENGQILLLPGGPAVAFLSECHDSSHNFVIQDGEALLAARPVPGVQVLCVRESDRQHFQTAEQWIAFNWQGRLMYVYSLAPHMVANARPSDGACTPMYSTTFAPITAMHQELWLQGSGTATLVRP